MPDFLTNIIYDRLESNINIRDFYFLYSIVTVCLEDVNFDSNKQMSTDKNNN